MLVCEGFEELTDQTPKISVRSCPEYVSWINPRLGACPARTPSLWLDPKRENCEHGEQRYNVEVGDLSLLALPRHTLTERVPRISAKQLLKPAQISRSRLAGK